ncbi:MAG: hypothetical protein QXJ17_00820 [Nitrososphaeria archaeon]
MKATIWNEHEKKLVVSSLVQFLYYKKVLSYQESSTLLKKIRNNKAEKMLDSIYENKSFKKEALINRRYRKYWLIDTAWRMKMRREVVFLMELACFVAAFFASKLGERSDIGLIYINTNMSDTLSILTSIYSDVNCFNVDHNFDATIPANMLVPVILGFETNLEIMRKNEVPYFAVNLLHKVSEVKRKMSMVYSNYVKVVKGKNSAKYFSYSYEKSIIRRFLDNADQFSLEEWRKICLNSLNSLLKDFEKAFGELRLNGDILNQNLPSTLSSSISWFLGRKGLEETVEVIARVPITQEDFDGSPQMYG